MKALLPALQKVGGALMLPIAVLPIAGLLLRLGQPDLLASVTMVAAGQSIFDNLGLLFAVGVAVGLARENHGAAGLASVVAYLVATKGAQVLIQVPPATLADLTGQARQLASDAYRAQEIARLSVPVGILSGLIAGALYNRFYNVRLPSYLSFFSGRRFVPIVSGVAGLALALAFGWQWQNLEAGMNTVSHAVLNAGALGLFLYGVLNRVLIVTGLHHIINNIAWFLLGDYHGVTGDLKRFFAGDPTAGAFMSGFFPVMMFGLPAACLAMYHTALPERRRLVAGLLGSIALTSLLTGVTEPIEFTFMFLAPLLYVLHALLTGVAFIIMNALHVRLGFGFSAGLIDYVLNYRFATRPLWLLPVGVGYFALYYLVFRFVIVKFDLATPGRERGAAAAAATTAAPRAAASGATAAAEWLAALGGAANLVSVDACTTRLRLNVASQAVIDEAALRRLGARGLVRPSAHALQVVVGPTADALAEEIRGVSLLETTKVAAPAAQVRDIAPVFDNRPEAISAAEAQLLLASLGGRDNVRAVEAIAGRVLVRVADSARVRSEAIISLGLRGVALPSRDAVHLVTGPARAASVASALATARG
jgi:PTS system N-acetylglucosamine-specific IIC component